MKNISLFLLATFLLAISTTINGQGVQQIWGTTLRGGNDGVGTIYSMKPDGTGFSKRHEFTTSFPGRYPFDTELLEYNNKFYGATYTGGTFGYGVIFEWDPLTDIYSRKADFPSALIGFPAGILALIESKIYGICGTDTGMPGIIFEYDLLTNIITKKFEFSTTDAVNPIGGLLAYNNKLYGMTMEGGINNKGVVFVYDPQNNTYQKIIDFDGANGRNPYINNFLNIFNNKIYGIVGRGGLYDAGVLYELDPVSNALVKKIDLNTTSTTFVGSMIPYLGKLYGMTLTELFEWDPVTNDFTVKYNLPDGANSCSKLIQFGDKFYGTTRVNTSPNASYLFEWDPVSNNFSKKAFFSETDGTFSGLTLKNNSVYGIQTGIGLSLFGRVFSYNISSNQYKNEFDFLNSENGVIPGEKLFFNKGVFYGLTSQGGVNNTGTVFTYNPGTTGYKKQANFESAGDNLPGPIGLLSELNGKLYGVAQSNSGRIFEWDTILHTVNTKINFNPTEWIQKGATPTGGVILIGNKFFGITREGGNNYVGVIFEWDPITNVYIKRFDFTTLTGEYPSSLTYKDGKVYGVTEFGGMNSAGVIFEWDPVTNIYTKRIDFGIVNGKYPTGKLAIYNNKFYGVTTSGGTNNIGVLYEWDPLTNIFTKLFDFDNVNGAQPFGSLVIDNNKLYGTTLSGSNIFGVVYEWDFNAASISKKHEFNGINGAGPNGSLIFVPALIAAPILNSCTSYPSITIDNSNNNQWVAITDNNGDVVAEIKANGNNLGTVSAQLYVNSGPVREDAAKKLYLDRSLSITPQTQPSSAVDIRLYITEAEYTALKNATNSQGQPSGITSITDLGMFKNSDACNSTIVGATSAVNNTNVVYDGGGYVITGSVTSFSSFYFANKAGAALPLALLDFSSELQQNNVLLKWKTAHEYNADQFIIQRSTDGHRFENIGSVPAKNNAGVQQYQYTDVVAASLGKPILYYRLHQKDNDNRQTYSNITAIALGNKTDVILWPNPVSNEVNFLLTVAKKEKIVIRILDLNGRSLKQDEFVAEKGSSTKLFNTEGLKKGTYIIEVRSETIHRNFKVVKQ